MEYYGLRVIYKKGMYYCIWTTDKNGDKFLIHDERVLSFKDKSALNLHCIKQGIYLEESEFDILDIPSIIEMKTMYKNKDKISFCKIFLNLWNLAIDVNNSFRCSNPYLDGCHDLYDKVFWGNNLDAFTYGKVKYVPHLSKKDYRQIKWILNEIYATFDRRL